jgi:hypothetical protein
MHLPTRPSSLRLYQNRTSTMSPLLLSLLLCCASQHLTDVQGFLVPSNTPASTSRLLAAKKQTSTLEEEEAPAGIVGSQFFGGSKEKEEYFDPVAEEKAGAQLGEVEAGNYHRFFSAVDNTPSVAFDTLKAAQVAASVQSQINSVLYESAAAPETSYTYNKNVKWETPLTKGVGTTPLEELGMSLEFYKNLDLAIVSGKQLSSSDSMMEFQWELSVIWPAFWSPSVLLFGTSVVRLEGTTIVAQTDTLIDSGSDMLNTIGSQIAPRFWDWYHIGMTPSAERMPRLNLKNNGGYQLYEMPSRLVMSPAMLEYGDREEGNARTIPNHAFSCIIKTMGPTRQRYVPTTPVEVQVIPGASSKLLKWIIPLAVEFQANAVLPIPGEDPEAVVGTNPQSGDGALWRQSPRCGDYRHSQEAL